MPNAVPLSPDTVSRRPLGRHLGAVTFEMLGSWAGSLPAGGLTEVLERMRAVVSGAHDPARVRP